MHRGRNYLSYLTCLYNAQSTAGLSGGQRVGVELSYPGKQEVARDAEPLLLLVPERYCWATKWTVTSHS